MLARIVEFESRFACAFVDGGKEPIMDKHLHDDPSVVTAEEGIVIVDGPDGVAVSWTPKAAAETSDRLMHSAAQAQGQVIERQRLLDEQKLHKAT